MLDAPAPHTILLPPRFAPRAYLGAGGFGSVWLVYDREREALVALKLTREWQPRALQRFKQEFRGLAGLVHPNLVTLYELVAEEPLCFFTMEFVPGRHFLAHVRPGHQAELAVTTLLGEPELERATVEVARAQGRLDEEALRGALWQLVEGVEALHEAGRLHRDIKPSNVMVTPTGRVVLLDFGLVTYRALKAIASGPLGAGAGQFVGTPQYMSPEQAMGHEVGPATDWYSVGAMLYEALCGQPPIVGLTPLQVLLRKQSQEPAPVWEVNPQAPPDLAVACMALLRRDPATRAGGAELRALLEPRRARAQTPVRQASVATPELVGRATQLRVLHGEGERLGAEQVGFVTVRGRSGMGKSLLVRTFLRQLAERQPDALILEWRCHEHEAVPYKALDGLVELVCDHLERERGAAPRGWLQEVLGPLVRLFPTAARLEAVYGLALEESGASGAELRLKGFEALRTLLARLSEERPLVLFVDDAQWGDEDSAALLDHLLEGPPLSLLFLVAWREEDEERSSFVQALRGSLARGGRRVRATSVVVDRLSEAESRQLVRSLFGHAGMDDGLLARVTREADGSPFMLDELARWARAAGEVRAPGSIKEMIAARVAALGEGARRLLEVVAVAGQPVERGLARQAAQLDGDEPAQVARLRNELMVRVTTARVTTASQAEALEVYHDRIREAVLDGMDAALVQQTHLKLAQALEALGADGEVVARHYIGAGREASAVSHVLEAAEHAAEALAFERAARLYAQALRLGTWGDAVRRALIARLGEMYAYLGRGSEAAEAYRQAVALATGRQAEELERLLAEQLLRSGKYEEGAALLERLLEQAGLRWAPAGTGLQAETLALKARLAWQGKGVRINRGELEEEARWQLELCWTAAQHLSGTHIKRGAYFGAQHLLLARQVGDPKHLALALALEAMNGSGSEEGRAQAVELLAQADTLAALVTESSYAAGFVTFARGWLRYASGRWQEAEQLYRSAQETMRRECRGVAWEVAGMQLYQLIAQEARGELSGFVDLLPAQLDEALRRRDGYHSVAYRIWSFRTHLTLDAPQRARRALDEAREQLPDQTFLLQHFWWFYASVNAALYEDQSARAWTLCMEFWPQIKGAQMMSKQLLGAQALELRGRSAVGAAVVPGLSSGTRRKLLQEAELCARRLERVGLTWTSGGAQLIDAQLAWLCGERSLAIGLLQEAEAALERSGTWLQVYGARLWRGQLLGGRGGAMLADEARRWMRERAIRSPERTLGMLLPASRVQAPL